MAPHQDKKNPHSHRTAESHSVVTAKDIAALTGVSVTTVSSILSGRNVVRVGEATRQLVLQTAQEKGYRRNQLATALRTGKTNTLGIVSPLTWNGLESIRHIYLTKLLTAISVAGAQAGMNAMTFIDSSFDQLLASKVADGRVEGVILFGLPLNLAGAAEWVKALEATGMPLVEIASGYSRYQVHADNFGGAKQAAQHLIELGHKNIGFLQSTQQTISMDARRDGFMAALREANLPVREPIVFDQKEELQAALSAPERPTSFFCASDRVAMYAYDAFREMGLRVPEDVSVIGFDNSLVSEVMRPSLTSVDNPLTAMAEKAVSLLLAQLNGEEILTSQAIVDTRLVIRESTTPPMRT